MAQRVETEAFASSPLGRKLSGFIVSAPRHLQPLDGPGMIAVLFNVPNYSPVPVVRRGRHAAVEGAPSARTTLLPPKFAEFSASARPAALPRRTRLRFGQGAGRA